jgi:murein DD-endopeptidase MepM/ murein hydrolase activator NlpD
MPAPVPTSPSRPSSRLTLAAFSLLAVLLVVLGFAVSAPADDLQTKLDRKEAALDDVKEKQGVLSTEIERYDDQISQLTGEVAALRNREAAVQAELDKAEAELEQATAELKILRERLARSMEALKERLVTIYKADDPSAIAVVLDSNGFDDALSRFEYLEAIQTQNADIVDRVRDLRNDTRETVARVRTTRDAIAARRAELARTRQELEAREAELDAARDRSAKALDEVGSRADRLEGGIDDIESEIQKQLAEAAAAESGVSPLPAGPVQGAGSGFIWPVNGPVVSPFGIRWGQPHEGIDIAVPAGTPIRAAMSGSIAFVQSEAASGGYGNYTCIDHGGGLATCYAHQSSFAITAGSVSQGDVIGYVGCTGHCYGDHLHFEVRVNGVAVDPMGYL